MVFFSGGSIDVCCSVLQGLGVDGPKRRLERRLTWTPASLANARTTTLLGDDASSKLRVIYFCDDKPPEMKFVAATLMDLIPFDALGDSVG